MCLTTETPARSQLFSTLPYGESATELLSVRIAASFPFVLRREQADPCKSQAKACADCRTQSPAKETTSSQPNECLRIWRAGDACQDPCRYRLTRHLGHNRQTNRTFETGFEIRLSLDLWGRQWAAGNNGRLLFQIDSTKNGQTTIGNL